MTVTSQAWSPSSWRERPALQQPEWPDPARAAAAVERLQASPPLVFAGEARALRESLANVLEGRAFLLQAGDCVESFTELSTMRIREKLKIMLQMSAVLTYGAALPVVKVGRIAGQFAKPRSAATEVIDGVELPSFRGHVVHSDEPNEAARVPDPERMLQGYYQAASTLNLLRAFTKGGFADLGRLHAWTQEFVATSPEGRAYDQLASEIDRALRFMRACGVDTESHQTLREVDFYTSHEALLLGYEEALTRQDSLGGGWYDCSAHMLWIGERTRQLDGAHIEFLRGVGNPVGCKVGPGTTADFVLELCNKLNPARIPGRLTLITRMGADHIEDGLRPLLRAARETGQPVVWACDPMHANTFTSGSGRKTRDFDDICGEIRGFVAAHKAEGTWPGGIHVELTGDNVTECVGGADNILDSQLDDRYQTVCDPRLNARQSLDLAFQVADMLRSTGLA